MGHRWTPATIKQALRLGIQIPSYRRAAESFEELTQVALSKSSLQELVAEYGGRLVEMQGREAEATVKVPEREDEVIWREMPEPDSEVMAVSLDGTMVNIREEGWKEVKVVTISGVEVEVPEERDEEKEVHLVDPSYRAGLWDVSTFAKQQWAEGCRRGLERAKQIVSVNDGAHWIWIIIMMCYAPCVEIIDWWHAVEKLWQMGNSLLGEGDQRTAVWVEQLKSLLWAGRLRDLLHEIRRLSPRGEPLTEKVREMISYIRHHRHRMDYHRYRKAGYPVGSGSVEAGCKVVVQERMKQAGMRWSRTGAQAMLALRGTLLSNRWNAMWMSLTPS